MNALKYIATLFLMLTITVSMGQKCKYSSKQTRRANKHFKNEKIIEATKLKPLFSKFSQAASANFAKSAENYYLSLVLVRELGRRIDVMEDNPLVVRFQNGETIILYPDRTLLGKFTIPVTTEINKPFYSVNAQQLQLFSEQPIAYVKVYFSSDKVAESKLGRDDMGTFFDYEILNKKLQASLMEPAKCIMNPS